jgi:hypothetical protein
MSKKYLLLRALAALLLAAAPAFATTGDQEFGDAVASYRAVRYSDAYGRMMALANAGDPDAARIVLFMHQYGPTLYGSYWDLNPEEARQFAATAASSRTRRVVEFQPSWEPPRTSGTLRAPRGAVRTISK